MASSKKAPWSANVMYWTDSHSCKTSGSMAGVLRLMFIALPAAKRAAVLRDLENVRDQVSPDYHQLFRKAAGATMDLTTTGGLLDLRYASAETDAAFKWFVIGYAHANGGS